MPFVSLALASLLVAIACSESDQASDVASAQEVLAEPREVLEHARLANELGL